MSGSDESLVCPHCGERLSALLVPDGMGWDSQIHHWVCFNDECCYFREGWDWMWQRYGQKVSYRYRVVNSATGATSPLAVRSVTALRNFIVDNIE